MINAVIRFKFNVAASAVVAHALTFLELIVRQFIATFRTSEIPDNPFLPIQARKPEDE